ncbi:MAG: poly-beta-hydroxybutyrate polymerase N-terminal domain-containing protein [Comamonadaceae bacterium]|nr:poly-beta-hydroxybutyrate polymerase N-terminal domain-containing protein [Comamonadaceae bacterium]
MTDHTELPNYPALDLPLKTAVARVTHGISPAGRVGGLLDWWTHLAVSPRSSRWPRVHGTRACASRWFCSRPRPGTANPA